MKKALQWIGWGVLALLIAAAFFSAERTTQWFVAGVVLVGWISHAATEDAKGRQRELLYRLDRLDERLGRLEDHAFRAQVALRGLEEMGDDYQQRKRAEANSPPWERTP